MDKTLTPHLLNEIKYLRHEVNLLKRTPQWRGQTFPVVELGERYSFGFNGVDSTTFADFYRGDVLLTAPILDYDIQTAALLAGTTPTSIEWQITGTMYFTDGGSGITTAVLASGSSDAGSWAAGFEQFFGTVDVTSSSLLGPEALYRYVRFDFEAKRTGGSGDAACLRLVKPPLLRLPS